MSTPSLRPLSFNVSLLSLYCQLLSIIPCLDKMASSPPEELLLWSLLSSGCGLGNYRNIRKGLVVESTNCVISLPPHPQTGHTLSEFHGVSTMGSARAVSSVHGVIMSSSSKRSPSVAPSLGWPCQCQLIVGFRWPPQPLRVHPPRGSDLPLWVCAVALLAAFESSQPGLEAQRGKSKPLKAGSDHRWKKKKKKWCKFRRRIAWRRGTELKEPLNARHHLWAFVYFSVIFLSTCVMLFLLADKNSAEGNY